MSPTRLTGACLFWLLLCTAGTFMRAAQAAPTPTAPNVVSLDIDRVVVFKDGHALIIKSAVGRADDRGAVFTKDVPDSAVLGSFWAVAERGEIRSVRAEWSEQTEVRRRVTPCLTVLELLRANVGRTLKLTIKDAPSITGTVGELLELPAAPVEAPPPTPSGAIRRHGAPALPPHPAEGETVETLQPSGATLVVIETDDGNRLVLPIARIEALAGAGLVTTTERREKVAVRSKHLRFDLGPDLAGQEVTLGLMYFTPGVRWIPTYRASGELESTAELALQGEILNELEDLDGITLDLVVGVPNFRFRSLVSPLTLEPTLVNALVTAAPNLMGQMSNAALFRQRGGEYRGTSNALVGPTNAPELARELAATGEQSLFVYTVEDFTLRKGDRAIVALWKNTVPLKHVYTMDVKVVRHARAGYVVRRGAGGAGGSGFGHGGAADGSPLQIIENAVWHQLELTNDSTVPWTTGAVMMLKGSLPLGQELLTYTSAGGRALVPVTVAVNVRGTYQEEEIGREANAIKWAGYSYARIRKSGTVSLTSAREETIKLRITVSCGGRAATASDDGRITINDHRGEDWEGAPYAINNHSDVSWELTLEPGASKTLTLEFEVYVR